MRSVKAKALARLPKLAALFIIFLFAVSTATTIKPASDLLVFAARTNQSARGVTQPTQSIGQPPNTGTGGTPLPAGTVTNLAGQTSPSPTCNQQESTQPLVATNNWNLTINVPSGIFSGRPTGQTSTQTFNVYQNGTFTASDNFGNHFALNPPSGLPNGTLTVSLKANSILALQNFWVNVGTSVLANVTISYALRSAFCQPAGVRIEISGAVNWPGGTGKISMPFKSSPTLLQDASPSPGIPATNNPTVAYFGSRSGITLGLDWSDSVPLNPTYNSITNSVDYQVGNSFSIDPVTVATSTNATPTASDYEGHTCYANGRFWVFYNDGTHEGWVSSTDGNTWTSESTFATSGVQSGYFAFYCSGTALYYTNAASATGSGMYYRYGTLNSDGTITWSISEGEFSTSSTGTRGWSTVLDSNGGWWSAFGSQVNTLGIEIWYCATPSSCTWTQSTNFGTTQNGYVPYPDLVPLTAGRMAVVWTSGPNTIGPLNIKTYSGSTWSSTSTLSGSYDIYNSACVSIGDTVECGVDNNNATIGYVSANYNGNSPTWSSFTQLVTCHSSICYASMSTDGVSTLALSFIKSSNEVGYFESTSSGAAWGPEVDLSTSESNAGGVSAPYSLGAYIQIAFYSSTTPPPYNVRFADVALQSPPMPTLPWGQPGLSPYESQVSSNGIVYVSQGSGLLTIEQPTFTLSGRGISLAPVLIYQEPPVMQNGGSLPYHTDNFTLADLGHGWMFNLPWLGTYDVHLMDGQEYPYAWSGTDMQVHGPVDFDLTSTSSGGVCPCNLTMPSGIRYNFNSAGQLTSETDPYGNSVSFSYGSNGYLSQITDTIGRLITFGYNPANQLTSMTAPGNRIWSFAYVGTDQLNSMTDPVGRVTTFLWYSNWLVNTVVYPTQGAEVYVTYGAAAVPGGSTYVVTSRNIYPTSSTLSQSDSISYTFYNGAMTSNTWTEADGSSNTASKPTFDGSASASAYGGSTIRVTLSTSHPNDIIAVYGNSMAYYATPPQITSISDSAGLVWTRRISTSAACGMGDNCVLDEWFARSSNVLSSDSITATFALGITGCGSRVTVFGVSGANYNNPWDVASPASNTGNSNTPSVSLTTASINDMLIGFAALLHTPWTAGYWTAGSGFTLIDSYGYQASEYGVAANIGAHTVQFTANGSNPWLIIADALKPGTIQGYIVSAFSPSAGVEKTYFENSTATFRIIESDFTGNRLTSMEIEDQNGNTLAQSLYSYDNWGNQIYKKDNIGQQTWMSYANTNSYNSFGSSGCSTSGFYSNSISPNIHNSLVGKCDFQNGAGSPQQETFYQYNTSGGLTEQKQSHNSGWLYTDYTYDSYGNVLSTKNANGNYTYFTYSSTYSSAYLTKQSLLAGTQNIATYYAYDSNTGFMTSTTDPNGQTTIFTYDKVGRTLTESLPTVIPTPTIDGVAYGEAFGGTTITATLSTSSHNDIILLEAGSAGYASVPHVSVVSDTAGLTWVQRAQYGGGSTDGVDEWYAKSVNPLSSDTITVAFSTTITGIGSWVKVFGVSGANFINPWDVSSVTASGTSNNPAASITTLTAYDLLVGNVIQKFGNPWTAGSGFTLLGNQQYEDAEYGTAVNQGSQTVQFSSNTYSYQWLIIADALKPGTQRLWSYDDVNGVITTTDPDGNVAKQYGDGIGRETKLERWNGTSVYTTIYATHNWIDMLASMQLPAGSTYSYAYDSVGGLLSTTNPDGTKSTTTYNYVSNSVTTRDEDGHVTVTTYDWNGRQTAVTLYSTSTQSFTSTKTYDLSGNLLLADNNIGQVTSYSYDDLNRLTSMTAPDGNITSYTYDNMGNLATKTTPNGTTITYTYDAANRLTKTAYPGGSSTTYTYDPDGNILTVSSTLSGTTTETYTYDAMDRLSSTATTVAGNTYTTSYGYDSASNLVSVTYPDNYAVSMTYDAVNRLKNVGSLATFSYNPDDTIAKIIFGDGEAQTYAYNNKDKVTSINDVSGSTNLLSLSYSYDRANNIVGINSETFAYDNMSRVTSSTGGWGTTTYTYDGASNMLGSTNGGTTVYSKCGYYPNSLSGSVIQCSTDKDGNIVSITGGWTYTYNYEDKMTAAKLSGVTKQTNVYDGNSMRVERTETNSTVFSYRGVNVMYEKDLTSGIATDHLYGNNMQVAKVTSGITYYYHEDQVGSNRLVTYVHAGSVTNKFYSDYQPYGANYGSSGSEIMQYTDRMQDSSDNLYYMNARIYNPSINRFMTKDPHAGAPCTCGCNSNLYSYAANNPLTKVDPTGDMMVAYDDGGGGGGTGGGATVGSTSSSPTTTGGGATARSTPILPSDPTQACVQQCINSGRRPDICLAECQPPTPTPCWGSCFWCEVAIDLVIDFGPDVACLIFAPSCAIVWPISALIDEFGQATIVAISASICHNNIHCCD